MNEPIQDLIEIRNILIACNNPEAKRVVARHVQFFAGEDTMDACLNPKDNRAAYLKALQNCHIQREAELIDAPRRTNLAERLVHEIKILSPVVYPKWAP